ncbi:MAG: type II toxin-antitoxin system RelE/ParE family toxin [Armatimonadota bacterium]
MSTDPQEVYAVRFSARASREINEATVRLADLTGDAMLAQEWLEGLYRVAATLATHPGRFALRFDESRKIGIEVRRLLYQRSAGSAAYHLYYRVEEQGEDGSRVIVLHLRHASRRPITRAEAKDIRSGT